MPFVLIPPPPCSRLPAPSHPPQLSSSTTSVKPLLNSQPVSASAPGSSYKLLSKHYTNITFYTQNSYKKNVSVNVHTHHLGFRNIYIPPVSTAVFKADKKWHLLSCAFLYCLHFHFYLTFISKIMFTPTTFLLLVHY